MKFSHFGGGGRKDQIDVDRSILKDFENNNFLYQDIELAKTNNATQGDGNHFFYVGRLKSTGHVALVTHHGSRGPGAKLYRRGMSTAEKFRIKISPETGSHNAWIPSETKEGQDYWDALQIIRAWTKGNHFAIHDLISKKLNISVKDRFWNEHNFVFRKSDGLFYHAKGATPAWDGFAGDSDGRTLIPLNMAEPILITRGMNAVNGLGFSPHGAGRNFSRTAYMKTLKGMEEKEIITGIPDISELPLAYKNAKSVREQIEKFGLAEVVDEIEPIGCIMAGDWQRDAPWRMRKDAK